MNTATKLRLGFIAALWLLLCYIIITSSPAITFYTLFVIVASGIVVFVPLYKKYVKKGGGGK